MGVEIRVEGLTKRFGSQTIWEDVSLTLPAGEISVLLGPSGTGKSVFLKTLVGLLKPNAGHIWINGKDLPRLREHDLYEVRKLFGVLFQDGALFGSMNLYDNIAFPLREHTKKNESEIKRIVLEKMEMTGLIGAERKLPGEISGGMRKRAGLARALVLDPEIILFDEPDSGLDPVRTAYLNQLIVDLNAEIKATFLIVTHDISTARTVPDNIGLLYRRHLAMFGPREMLLSSDEPVVRQFLNGQRQGPIGMAEEKDAGELAQEKGELPPLPPIPPQLPTSDGRVRESMRPPGSWLKENGVTPPPGSYMGEGEWKGSMAPGAGQDHSAGANGKGNVRLTKAEAVEDEYDDGAVTVFRPSAGSGSRPAKKTTATKATAQKSTAKKTAGKKAAPAKTASAAKKATASKAAAKKTVAKKTVAKKTAKKTAKTTSSRSAAR